MPLPAPPENYSAREGRNPATENNEDGELWIGFDEPELPQLSDAPSLLSLERYLDVVEERHELTHHIASEREALKQRWENQDVTLENGWKVRRGRSTKRAMQKHIELKGKRPRLLTEERARNTTTAAVTAQHRSSNVVLSDSTRLVQSPVSLTGSPLTSPTRSVISPLKSNGLTASMPSPQLADTTVSQSLFATNSDDSVDSDEELLRAATSRTGRYSTPGKYSVNSPNSRVNNSTTGPRPVGIYQYNQSRTTTTGASTGSGVNQSFESTGSPLKTWTSGATSTTTTTQNIQFTVPKPPRLLTDERAKCKKMIQELEQMGYLVESPSEGDLATSHMESNPSSSSRTSPSSALRQSPISAAQQQRESMSSQHSSHTTLHTYNSHILHSTSTPTTTHSPPNHITTGGLQAGLSPTARSVQDANKQAVLQLWSSQSGSPLSTGSPSSCTPREYLRAQQTLQDTFFVDAVEQQREENRQRRQQQQQEDAFMQIQASRESNKVDTQWAIMQEYLAKGQLPPKTMENEDIYQFLVQQQHDWLKIYGALQPTYEMLHWEYYKRESILSSDGTQLPPPTFRLDEVSGTSDPYRGIQLEQLHWQDYQLQHSLQLPQSRPVPARPPHYSVQNDCSLLRFTPSPHEESRSLFHTSYQPMSTSTIPRSCEVVKQVQERTGHSGGSRPGSRSPTGRGRLSPSLHRPTTPRRYGSNSSTPVSMDISEPVRRPRPSSPQFRHIGPDSTPTNEGADFSAGNSFFSNVSAAKQFAGYNLMSPNPTIAAAAPTTSSSSPSQPTIRRASANKKGRSNSAAGSPTMFGAKSGNTGRSTPTRPTSSVPLGRNVPLEAEAGLDDSKVNPMKTDRSQSPTDSNSTISTGRSSRASGTVSKQTKGSDDNRGRREGATAASTPHKERPMSRSSSRASSVSSRAMGSSKGSSRANSTTSGSSRSTTVSKASKATTRSEKNENRRSNSISSNESDKQADPPNKSQPQQSSPEKESTDSSSDSGSSSTSSKSSKSSKSTKSSRSSKISKTSNASQKQAAQGSDSECNSSHSTKKSVKSAKSVKSTTEKDTKASSSKTTSKTSSKASSRSSSSSSASSSSTRTSKSSKSAPTPTKASPIDAKDNNGDSDHTPKTPASASKEPNDTVQTPQTKDSDAQRSEADVAEATTGNIKDDASTSASSTSSRSVVSGKGKHPNEAHETTENNGHIALLGAGAASAASGRRESKDTDENTLAPTETTQQQRGRPDIAVGTPIMITPTGGGSGDNEPVASYCTAKRSLNDPVWNECCEFPVDSQKNPVMQIIVCDHNPETPNKMGVSLGGLSIRLAKLFQGSRRAIMNTIDLAKVGPNGERTMTGKIKVRLAPMFKNTYVPDLVTHVAVTVLEAMGLCRDHGLDLPPDDSTYARLTLRYKPEGGSASNSSGTTTTTVPTTSSSAVPSSSSSSVVQPPKGGTPSNTTNPQPAAVDTTPPAASIGRNPSTSPTREGSKQTKAVNSEHPQWDEVFTFNNNCDLNNPNIGVEVSLFDGSINSSSLMGTVTIKLASLTKEPIAERWVPLRQYISKSSAGKIKVIIDSSDRTQFQITVKEGQDLPFLTDGSNGYIVRLKVGEPKSSKIQEFHTTMVRGDNPKWDQQFSWQTVTAKYLLVTFVDRNFITSKEVECMGFIEMEDINLRTVWTTTCEVQHSGSVCGTIRLDFHRKGAMQTCTVIEARDLTVRKDTTNPQENDACVRITLTNNLPKQLGGGSSEGARSSPSVKAGEPKEFGTEFIGKPISVEAARGRIQANRALNPRIPASNTSISSNNTSNHPGPPAKPKAWAPSRLDTSASLPTAMKKEEAEEKKRGLFGRKR